MPNRTMTEIQILSHLEQMEAMRAEFNFIFDPQKDRMREQGYSEAEIIKHQIWAWDDFRKTRKA